jgi:hypothetical protein
VIATRCNRAAAGDETINVNDEYNKEHGDDIQTYAPVEETEESALDRSRDILIYENDNTSNSQMDYLEMKQRLKDWGKPKKNGGTGSNW